MATQVKNKAPNKARAKSAAQSAKVKDYVNRHVEKTRRQVKTIDLISGLIGLFVLVIGFFLVAALVDGWIWTLTGTARLVGLCLLIGMIAVYSLVFIIPLLFRRINPEYAAKMIEESTPTFQNSLLNYLRLGKKPKEVKTAVYDAVARQAATNLASVPAEKTVDQSAVIRAGILLVAVVIAAIGYKVLSPKDPMQTVYRLIWPAAKISKPAVVQVLDVSPGDTRVFFGEELEITARIRGKHEPGDVNILFSTDDGQRSDVPISMTADESGMLYNGLLSTSGTGIQQSLRYRVVARDGSSPEFKVTVRSNPTITVEKVDIVPPKYTQLPSRTIEGRGDIEAVEDSQITVHATANMPIKSAFLEFLQETDDDANPYRVLGQARQMQVDDRAASTRIEVNMNEKRTASRHSHYRIRFETTEGDRNKTPNVYPIRVTPDLAPEITIVNPKSPASTPENHKLAIDIEANDLDYEISQIEVRLDHAGRTLVPEVSRLKFKKGPNEQFVTARYYFDPEWFGLKAGDTISFKALATDNRVYRGRQAGNQTLSEELKIVINPKAEEPDPNEQKKNEEPSPEDQQDNSQQDDSNQDDKQENSDAKTERQNDEQETGENDDQDQSNDQGDDQSDSDDEGSENDDDQNSDDGEDGSENKDQVGGSDSGNSDSKDEGDPDGAGSGSEENSDPENGGGDSEDNGDAENGGNQTTGSEDNSVGETGAERSQGTGTEEGDQTGSGASQDGTSEENAGDNRTGEGQDSSGSSENQLGNGGDERSNGSADDPGRRDNALTQGDEEPLDENATEGEQVERLKEYFEQQDEKNQGQKTGEAGDPNAPEQKSNDEPAKSNEGQRTDQPSGGQAEGDINDAGTDPASESKPQKENRNPNDPSNDKQSQNDPNNPNGDGKVNPSGESQKPDPGSGEGSESSPPESNPSQSNPSESNPSESDSADSGTDQAGGGSGSEGDAQSKPKESQNDNPDGGKDGKQPERENNSPKTENENGNPESDSEGQPQTEASSEKGDSGQSSKGGSPSNDAAPPPPGGEKTEGQNQAQGAASSLNAKSVNGASQTGGVKLAKEKENIEHAKKATDLILNRLQEQQYDPDPALLEKMNWTEDDLQRFLKRWQSMKKAAEGKDAKAKQDYLDALESLGLSPRSPQSRRIKRDKLDQLHGLSEDSAVNRAPAEIEDKIKAFLRERNRAKKRKR